MHYSTVPYMVMIPVLVLVLLPSLLAIIKGSSQVVSEIMNEITEM